MTIRPESDIDEVGPASPARRTPRALAGEFLRYLIVGCTNTLVTYVIYLILLNWIRYEFAYAAGYAVGIGMAYALSARFVFRKPMGRRSALRFPLVYIAQFVVSMGLLRIAVEVAGIPEWLALGFAIALTVPVTFLIARWILHAG